MDALDADDYDVAVHGGFYGSMYNKAGLWWVAPDDIEIWRSRTLGSVTVSFDDREASDSLFFEEHLAEMDKYAERMGLVIENAFLYSGTQSPICFLT